MVRMVYQNFLLPEIPKFFGNFKSYLIQKYPSQQWIEIQARLNNLTPNERKKKENQFERKNEERVFNAKKYSFKYINPLHQCPTLEQIIVQRVFNENNSKPMDQFSIAIMAQNLNGKDIESCVIIYRKKLKEFLNQNSIDEACRLLPVLYYKSANQLCEKEKNIWKDLTKDEQFLYESRFVTKMNNFYARMSKVAVEEGMTLKDIISAKQKQYLPPSDPFYSSMFS